MAQASLGGRVLNSQLHLPISQLKRGGCLCYNKGMKVRSALVLFAFSTALIGHAEMLSISCPRSNGWKMESAECEDCPGVTVTTVRFSAKAPTVRPAFTALAVIPQADAQAFWHTDAWYANLRPAWRDAHHSDVRTGLPLYSVMTASERSRLTLASDNCVRPLDFSCGTDERGNVRATWKVPASDVPMTNDIIRFRTDRRDLFWSDAVHEAASWTHAFYSKAFVPPEAFKPVYSTWYAFHTDVTAEKVVREAKLASDLGLEVFFLDAGWYMDKPGTFARPAGDWNPSRHFPDFRKTVAAVKASGMKFVLWYGLPLVGHESKAAARFKGMYMGENRGGAYYLDPRVPAVREHLISTLERAVREWDVDGFKIDYIYAWSPVKPASEKEGRDMPELNAAVVALVGELHARLRAIKPDILLEFTHGHHNAAMRPNCTMYRVADCAGDVQENRSALVRLRLTNGETSCHSDMLTWGRDDSPENAARQILACLFGTVQYSIPLVEARADQLAVMRHWIGFMKRHEHALQHGDFRPHHPEANYPVIEAGDAEENVTAVYLPGMAVRVPSDKRRHYIVNATGTNEILVDCARAAEAKAFAVTGEPAGRVKLAPGVRKVRVPAFGYLVL